ncbi:MAG: hypothetical protein IJU23_03860 [Proteobacteria bacterium]|nr:hypothetical protein [Pseudomonadota bacterium]
MVFVGTADDANFKGVMPLLEACLSKNTTKEHQNQTTNKYHVQLEQEDYDMTAGEQIVYEFKRQLHTIVRNRFSVYHKRAVR